MPVASDHQGSSSRFPCLSIGQHWPRSLAKVTRWIGVTSPFENAWIARSGATHCSLLFGSHRTTERDSSLTIHPHAHYWSAQSQSPVETRTARPTIIVPVSLSDFSVTLWLGLISSLGAGKILEPDVKLSAGMAIRTERWRRTSPHGGEVKEDDVEAICVLAPGGYRRRTQPSVLANPPASACKSVFVCFARPDSGTITTSYGFRIRSFRGSRSISCRSTIVSVVLV